MEIDLLITGKVLVLNFFETGNMVRSFEEPKNFWEIFLDDKSGFFFSQKIEGKMIFTWYFLAFHDIPGLGKYGFSCS